MDAMTRTHCPYCSLQCGMTLERKGRTALEIQPRPDFPVNEGALCRKGWTANELRGHRDRLTTPLYREDLTDDFRPIRWEEALDLAAARLTAIRAESGPAAIFHYRSGGSLGILKHLSDYFFEQFGPVTMKRGDICSGAGDEAQTIDFGIELWRRRPELASSWAQSAARASSEPSRCSAGRPADERTSLVSEVRARARSDHSNTTSGSPSSRAIRIPVVASPRP